MEMSNTGLSHQVGTHDEKLSRLEARVLDMYAFMKCHLGSTYDKGKGKGKGTRKEKMVEVDKGKDVDVIASSHICANSSIYDPAPIMTPFERPMSIISWLSMFLLDIHDV